MSVDGAADAEIHHPAFGDARTQRVAGIGHVGRPHAVRPGLTVGRGCRRLRTLRNSRRARRRSGRDQIGDHILALIRGLQSRERHLVLRDQLLRIEQIGVERGGVPDEIGGLHRGRIIVVGHLSRLLADDAGETRAERVLAGLQRMAGLAFSVDLAACCRIAVEVDRGGRCRESLSNGLRWRSVRRHDVGRWMSRRRRIGGCL